MASAMGDVARPSCSKRNGTRTTVGIGAEMRMMQMGRRGQKA